MEIPTPTNYTVNEPVPVLKWSLEFQKLTDACMPQVAYEALLRTSCTHLDLSANKLTDDGIAVLASNLTTNQVRINIRLYAVLSRLKTSLKYRKIDRYLLPIRK